MGLESNLFFKEESNHQAYHTLHLCVSYMECTWLVSRRWRDAPPSVLSVKRGFDRRGHIANTLGILPTLQNLADSKSVHC